MKTARRRIDVNLEELDRVLDDARQAPLSEADHDKLKDTLHAMAAPLIRSRNTEKTSAVVDKPGDPEAGAGAQADDKTPPAPGHGRNGAEAFGGARKVSVLAETGFFCRIELAKQNLLQHVFSCVRTGSRV